MTVEELLPKLVVIAATDPTAQVLIDCVPVRRIEKGTVVEGMELVGGRWIDRKWVVKGEGAVSLKG